ncbi:MAG: thioredoxin domain-containing protein [Marmoricola sp.]
MSDTMPGTAADPDDETPERSNVLLLVLGGLAAISAVIAALVIFSGGGGAAEKPEAPAPVSAGQSSVVVGKAAAGTKVVVLEDFASPESRAFEIASRDFLRIAAAQGRVQVEYRPLAGSDAYSRDARAAWSAVLDGAGTPKQALAFHDALFDRQPTGETRDSREFLAWAKDAGIDDQGALDAIATAGAAATDADRGRVPTVLVDGTGLTAASPVALADALQRLLLEKD